jgi:hypothetical protein
MESKNLKNINLPFGGSFEIEDWVFDSKGHKANVSTHSIFIPKGSLESKNSIELLDSNVIVGMELVPESGKITIERKDIVDLKLTEVDNTSTEIIDFSEDTLGVALSKV